MLIWTLNYVTSTTQMSLAHFAKACHYIYSIMAVNLSLEAVTICDLNFLTSYKIPVIVLNEVDTKSDIKGCVH